MEIQSIPMKKLIVEALSSYRDFNRERKADLQKALDPRRPEPELLKSIENRGNKVPQCSKVIREFQECERVVINRKVEGDLIVEGLKYYAQQLREGDSMLNASKLIKVEQMVKDMEFKLELMAA